MFYKNFEACSHVVECRWMEHVARRLLGLARSILRRLRSKPPPGTRSPHTKLFRPPRPLYFPQLPTRRGNNAENQSSSLSGHLTTAASHAWALALLLYHDDCGIVEDLSCLVGHVRALSRCWAYVMTAVLIYDTVFVPKLRRIFWELYGINNIKLARTTVTKLTSKPSISFLLLLSVSSHEWNMISSFNVIVKYGVTS